ncbi:MAG: formate C-acetyltransferase [Candidatus Dojkabacteria bacterium]|nr:MAG: formate C-acetyltransferase [Candidatus Dojkabacteria bacterium]
MGQFKQGRWTSHIDVRDFVQKNYTPYEGDSSFLARQTVRTEAIWSKVLELINLERQKGILDLDVNTPSTITSHQAGYIDRDQELIVGLQTDAPLKRSIKPNGGIRLVEQAAEAYGYKIPEEVSKIYYKYRKTHNDGVFDAYSPEIKLLRSKHIITGLPDNYGRGRIIGDYRRVPLYGTARLIEERESELNRDVERMDEDTIRRREELSDQVTALHEMEEMAKMYGFDISRAAEDSKEAIQWLYFAYLAAVKQQDGAAMSLGRIDAFLDIYIDRDLAEGKYNESQIQEMIDDFVIKLRIVKHLRPPEYNALFAGDPTWVTMVLGGTGIDGRNMVTKSSFRFLHTLTNLGPAPEPNLTVLWGDKLPRNWKNYCAAQSIACSSIQYENDDLMKPYYGDDYGIACCVSGMTIGKDMQFFGARANLAKLLLLTINGGKEEPKTHNKEKIEPGGDIVISGMKPLNQQEYLQFDEVYPRFMELLDWLAQRYVAAMNVIHYMHDKYHYESAEMALHDMDIRRFMAFGVAGLSVVVDSLSAIKYAKVRPVWNDRGVAEMYLIEGEFPAFGNDDDRVDTLAVEIVEEFIKCLRKYEVYRDSVHTLSVLTITSNVVYGEATGATPDGRQSGVPFAPGANPMHGRDKNGAIASLNSVAKIPYAACQDGVSNTFSIVPSSLGKDSDERISNLVQMMDGYFVGNNGHHLNVNVFDRETLLDAQQHPEKYPQLTIRVSGYAVNFNNLSKIQQDEVIARTFHSSMD